MNSLSIRMFILFESIIYRQLQRKSNCQGSVQVYQVDSTCKLPHVWGAHLHHQLSPTAVLCFEMRKQFANAKQFCRQFANTSSLKSLREIWIQNSNKNAALWLYGRHD